MRAKMLLIRRSNKINEKILVSIKCASISKEVPATKKRGVNFYTYAKNTNLKSAKEHIAILIMLIFALR